MPAKNNLRSQVTRKMFDAAKQQQDNPKDAVALLKADHVEAKGLYKKFFKAKTAELVTLERRRNEKRRAVGDNE